MASPLSPEELSFFLDLIDRCQHAESRREANKKRLVNEAPLLLFRNDGSSEYLLKIHSRVREGLPTYLLFTEGYFFQFTKLSPFDRRFSIIGFPKELESRRPEIQRKFSETIMATEETLGWVDGPCNRLPKEQQAMCMPIFVEDNITFIPL